MAAVSLLLFRYNLTKPEISVEPAGIRMFKHESRSAVIRIGALGSGFSKVSSVSVVSPYGLTAEPGRLDRGAMELTVRPKFAGAFAGIRATIHSSDILGLFTQTQDAPLGLVVESLPVSLLLPDLRLLVSPMAQGEIPSGARGSGQELYGIEPYIPGSDARDVMWKRADRSVDGSLQVKARETNARGVVGIALALGAASTNEGVSATDLASEAIAQLGKRLISLGIRVELAYLKDGAASRTGASNLRELAGSIVSSWSRDASGVGLLGRSEQTDLLVLGPEDLEKMSDDVQAMGGLTLVIWDRPGPPDPNGRVFVFNGEGDLAQLAEALLEG